MCQDCDKSPTGKRNWMHSHGIGIAVRITPHSICGQSQTLDLDSWFFAIPEKTFVGRSTDGNVPSFPQWCWVGPKHSHSSGPALFTRMPATRSYFVQRCGPKPPPEGVRRTFMDAQF